MYISRGSCVTSAIVIGYISSVMPVFAAWAPDMHFRIDQVHGKPCLVSPAGEPFKSVGMVWAYGPERGPNAGELTAERVIAQLKVIKELGFNTLNLYGDRFIPEMLAWCDENEMAVYFRTTYYSLPDFPGDLKEYPDYMDPAFREMAKRSYGKLLSEIKGHPSVLAVDMDHRWLFPLDWGGSRRIDVPKIRAKGLAFFPKWLEARYGTVEKLNAAWGTTYAAFEDVLKDESLVRDNAFVALKNHPGRADVVRYALWTPADFLKELSAFLRAQAPGVLITPTTEHPECIPETNPDASSGIAFMSPVHYNGLDDFDRDLPGLCKLVYETRWHYDLQGGPTYISETGFRTSTLEQKPPTRTYAWVEPADEETAARAYARQFALMNVLPWLSGYGYFMLYDKWAEGDFGYLRDDGTKKPMALVGDAINGAFDCAALADPEPQVWIYYPDYAMASHRPGFQQLKSWVAIWEAPFFRALDRRVDDYWKELRLGNPRAGRKFAKNVTKDFRKTWRGFAFCKTLPNDDKPIVLLSTVSELLSAKDRAALLNRRTLTFGPVGVRDDFMRETAPWHLEAIGLRADQVREQYFRLNLTNATVCAVPAPAGTNSPWPSIPATEYDRGVPCQGQTVAVPAGRYTRLELLAGAAEGNAAAFCDLEYDGGVRVRKPLGPTISDMQYEPMMTDGVASDGRFLSRVLVPLEPSRELTRITLPSAPWLRVFGAVLVNGGVATGARVVLPGKSGVVSGETPWWQRLPSGIEGVQVLKSFDGGDPAVVAAGPHVAFLFDPLTWAGKPDEVSRNTAALDRDWITPALNYLKKARTEP